MSYSLTDSGIGENANNLFDYTACIEAFKLPTSTLQMGLL